MAKQLSINPVFLQWQTETQYDNLNKNWTISNSNNDDVDEPFTKNQNVNNHNFTPE